MVPSAPLLFLFLTFLCMSAHDIIQIHQPFLLHRFAHACTLLHHPSLVFRLINDCEVTLVVLPSCDCIVQHVGQECAENYS